MNLKELISFTKKLNILYVEDNIDAREQTASMLDNFFDSINVAVDGLDGLNQFNNINKNLDIIITDIDMPKMDGIEMIRKIRELNSSVYIIILSAHKETGYLQNIDKIGANNYILKPIDIKEFMNILNDFKNEQSS